MARRPYGSGSLFPKTDTTGKESWYGRWYIGGQQVKRKIGPKRVQGSREGLTRAQAEREMRRRMQTEKSVIRSRITISDLGDRYMERLEQVLERKPTTLGDYCSMLRKHIKPFFGERPIVGIDTDWISRYIAEMKRKKLATKTIINHLAFLHGLFSFAVKRGWTQVNPVDGVDRPLAAGGDPDIRFLDLDELEALLRGVPSDYLRSTDHALYLTGAMTGLRQGELVALRWIDVDWEAGRIRVRRNYTRQKFGTPKAKRSSRSVPMTDRVAGELEWHFKRSAFQGDEDLVFCHPQTGNPLDASKLRKRYKKALKAVALRPVRFHDLRHTFGTHCAAAGVSMRTLQEWMGHRDIKTTLIYADYAPSDQENAMVERAFRQTDSDDVVAETSSP